MLPRLDMKHLAVLVALSQTGSVTAAAARLGLTQSAVSHRLREAERRTGVVLAERHERGVRLTEEGDRLRVTAEGILDELARVEGQLRAQAGEDLQLVRIGQATYSRYHWFPAFVEYVASVEPKLRVDLAGAAAVKPFAALSNRSVDMVTVYGREISPGRYRWYKLGSDPLVAVVAPGHRLAERAYLDGVDIASERYFAYPLSAEPGYEWEALIGAPSVPFRQLTQMATPEAVVDLVRAGVGVGVFSRWAVEPEVANGTLVALPITAEGMTLDWWAVVRADEPDDSPASRLARAAQRWSNRYKQGLATLAFEASGNSRIN